MRILNKNLHPSSWPLDYCGWLEEGRYNREFEVYDKYLKPEHTFVDLGAWVGAHTLYAATIAKQVISVEPDPVAFDILKLNATNPVRKAISDKPGVATLGSGFLGASTTRFNPSAGSGIGPWEEGQTFDVECVTLRELIKQHLTHDPMCAIHYVSGTLCTCTPLFIKVDVEGAEERIFSDVDFFKMVKPVVLVELHPWWWENPVQALRDFDEVKYQYQHPIEVFHNTWVFCD